MIRVIRLECVNPATNTNKFYNLFELVMPPTNDSYYMATYGRIGGAVTVRTIVGKLDHARLLREKLVGGYEHMDIGPKQWRTDPSELEQLEESEPMPTWVHAALWEMTVRYNIPQQTPVEPKKTQWVRKRVTT